MNKSYIFILLLLSIVLVFTSCEHEHIANYHYKKSPYQVSLNSFKEQTKISNLNSYLKKLTPKTNSRNTESLTFEDFDIDTTSVLSFPLSDNRPSFSFKLDIKENVIEGENYNLFIRQIDDEWFSSIFLFVDDNDTTNDTRFSTISEIYTEDGIVDHSRSRGIWAETTVYHCTGTGPCASGVCDLCYLCVSTSATYISITSQGDFGDDMGGGTENYGDGGVYNEGGGGGGGSSPSSPDIPCDNRDLTGDCLYNALDFVVEVKNCLGDQLSEDAQNWLDNTVNYQQMMQIRRYLADALCSPDAQDFILYAIGILTIDSTVNPFLGADCRSFEYAFPPGAYQRGCAVTDFNHTFYALGIDSDGSPYYGDVDSNIDLIYFTMPTWMTNGQAANLTAEAVTDAIRETDLYFFENPYDSEFEVGDFFRDALISNLALVGGSVSTTIEPFPIPNPAPYITSFFGASTDCN